MHPTRRHLLAWAPLIALAACASPDPALYTLASVPGQARPGGPRSVELRRIGLANYLDRPGIVQSSDGIRIHLADDARWGEPLGDMLVRVLAEDLTQRLPGSIVFPETGAISTDPDVIVEIDLNRFNPDPSGAVALDAQAAVRSSTSHAAIATRAIHLTVTPAGPTTADIVTAMSNALAQLADSIAGALRR
jgi:uncharacterized lipoprotein YmbA